MMQEVADVKLVVNLKLREEALIAKIKMEESSSAPRIFIPPLLPPPSCASRMTTCADDTEEVVQRRLRICYEEICSLNLGQ
ncbi:unnamed protein product [Sphagnum tenellum]